MYVVCLYVKTQRWALTAECSRKSAPYTAVSGHFLLGTGKKTFFKKTCCYMAGVKFGVKGWHPDQREEGEKCFMALSGFFPCGIGEPGRETAPQESIK